jgi:hypothetical protein
MVSIVIHAFFNTVAKWLPSNDARCRGSHSVCSVLQEVIIPELHELFDVVMCLSAFALAGTEPLASLSTYFINCQSSDRTLRDPAVWSRPNILKDRAHFTVAANVP